MGAILRVACQQWRNGAMYGLIELRRRYYSFEPNLSKIGRKTTKCSWRWRLDDWRHVFVFRFSYLGESPQKISDLYVKKWLRKGKMKNILQTHRQTDAHPLPFL